MINPTSKSSINLFSFFSWWNLLSSLTLWLCQISTALLSAISVPVSLEVLVYKLVQLLVMITSFLHKVLDILVWILQEWILLIPLPYCSHLSLCSSIWVSHSSPIILDTQSTKPLVKECVLQILEALQPLLNSQMLSLKNWFIDFAITIDSATVKKVDLYKK